MELIVIFLAVAILYFFIRSILKSFGSPKSESERIDIEVQVTTEPIQRNEVEDSELSDIYYFPVENIPRKIFANLKLQYLSTSGEETKREIDVTTFYRGQEGCHFEGFDHLRNARRKLSSRGVKQAVDLDTGELIVDLCAFFEQKYIDSPDYPYDNLFEKHGNEIYCLVYIAAADGAVRSEEREIIVSYCLEQKEFKSLDREKLNEIIKNIYRPTKYEYHKSIRRIEPDSANAKNIWSFSNRIVETNSKQHSEQVRALEYIRKQLKIG